MSNRKKKRLLLGGTMAVGIVLATSSVAFACTVYWGQIGISGNGTGNSSKLIVGNPNGGAFNWCPTDVPSSTDTSNWGTYWPTRVTDSLTVGMKPSQDCLPTWSGGPTVNKLPAGGYSVGISSGYWGEDNLTDEENCHSLEGMLSDGITPKAGSPGYGHKIANDTFIVDSSGNGRVTYSGTTLTNALDSANRNAGWYTVCVYYDNEGVPNQRIESNAANFKQV